MRIQHSCVNFKMFHQDLKPRLRRDVNAVFEPVYHFNPCVNFCIVRDVEFVVFVWLFYVVSYYFLNCTLFNICWKKIKHHLKQEMSHRLGLSFINTLISECNIPTQLMNGWQTTKNKIINRPLLNSLCSFTEKKIMSVMFICDHTVPHFTPNRFPDLNDWIDE